MHFSTSFQCFIVPKCKNQDCPHHHRCLRVTHLLPWRWCFICIPVLSWQHLMLRCPTYIVMEDERAGKNCACLKTHSLIHSAGPRYGMIEKDNIGEKADSAAARQMLQAWSTGQEQESIRQRPLFTHTAELFHSSLYTTLTDTEPYQGLFCSLTQVLKIRL